MRRIKTNPLGKTREERESCIPTPPEGEART